MNYESEDLLNDIETKSRDEMIDILIGLGDQNVFIPIMINCLKLAKKKKKYRTISLIEEYINASYSPGLRAHILDDFIRERLKIESNINELKAKHSIYVLEQKLALYKQAESMIRSNSTLGATHEVMKILEFRGDLEKNTDEGT